MADKINKEESIARVYQFLNKYNGNWKADADRNDDGYIIRTEFSTFLKTSDFDWNGLESQKDDVITAFWKSIDTSTNGKITNSKNVSDKGALNSEELAVAGNNIKATDIINKYVKNAELPNGLDSKYQLKWKNSVKTGMINRAIALLKGTKEELSEEEIRNILTEEKLGEIFRLSAVKATADYKATQELDRLKQVFGDIDYTVGDDKVISGIINQYIKNLDPEKDLDTICQEIEDIIMAYIDTAQTNSKESIDILTEYDYEPSELNPLQKAVIQANLKNEVEQALSDKQEFYNEYKTVINQKIAQYIGELAASGQDFNTIIENISSIAKTFITNELAALEKEYNEKQEALRKARIELNEYIATILAEKNSKKTAIIEAEFGTTDSVEIMNQLLKINKIEDINAIKTRIETKIKEYESKKYEFSDKSKELKDWNPYKGLETLAFYVASDGSITFVNYERGHGSFDDDVNTELSNKINSIKSKLRETYQELIDELGISEQELANIFNASLFKALSDESVVPSQYSPCDMEIFVNAVIDNFAAYLKGITAEPNGKLRKYIKEYNNLSLLAGRTPLGGEYGGYAHNSDLNRNMTDGGYYEDDNTGGGDDWVSVHSEDRYESSYSYGGGTGNIIHLTDNINDWKDAQALNDGLDRLLRDYIDHYRSMIDANRIIQLYRQAEETAFNKMCSMRNSEHPDGTAVYGYGENYSSKSGTHYGSDNYDTMQDGTWVNCGSVLLEVMYEMEALIAREMSNIV